MKRTMQKLFSNLKIALRSLFIHIVMEFYAQLKHHTQWRPVLEFLITAFMGGLLGAFGKQLVDHFFK